MAVSQFFVVAALICSAPWSARAVKEEVGEGVRLHTIEAIRTTDCTMDCNDLFGLMVKEDVCKLDDCAGCPGCTKEPEEPAKTYSIDDVKDENKNAYKNGCENLYVEKQEGLNCGKHAAMAVIKNLGSKVVFSVRNWTEKEKVYEEDFQPGQMFSITTIKLELERVLGSGSTQVVGDLSRGKQTDTAEKVGELLKSVGQVDQGDIERQKKLIFENEENGFTDKAKELKHALATLEAGKFDVTTEELEWLVCLAGEHFYTFFKPEGSSDFCKLDSMYPERRKFSPDELRAHPCRAVIVPVPSEHAIDPRAEVDTCQNRVECKKMKDILPEDYCYEDVCKGCKDLCGQ